MFQIIFLVSHGGPVVNKPSSQLASFFKRRYRNALPRHVVPKNIFPTMFLLLLIPVFITGSAAIPSTCTHLCIHETLDTQSTYQWDDNIKDSSGSCGFVGKAYEITAYAANLNGGSNSQMCFARKAVLTDCEYQVRMQIHKGIGGLVFGYDDPPSPSPSPSRGSATHSSNSNMYYFGVDADGNFVFDYIIITSLMSTPVDVHNRNGNSIQLAEGQSDAISNNQQMITLTIKISPSQVDLFINGTLVNSETNAMLANSKTNGGAATPPITIGHMGLGAGDFGFAQDSDVTFSSVSVSE